MSSIKSRSVIGIPFNYDENWIGGTYFVKNLIASVNLALEHEQPDIWLLSHQRSSFDFIQTATGYRRLNWLRPAQLADATDHSSRKYRLLGRFVPGFLKRKPQFDLVFPFPIGHKLQQTACWIPDFQDKRMPEFFDAGELAVRERQHREYFENYQHVVFSSAAARDDFDHFYPEARVERHIMHFAVFEPQPAASADAAVLAKYALARRYFYCPNQFWIHKNHGVVISAVALLKKAGIDVMVVFSGKEHDYRAPGHTEKLKARVQDEGLDSNIRFLGFLPRDDQMIIMRRAICIIQPSFFEGWSTVIEDAKSLSQFVLASRIPPNVEQASENIAFFDPKDPDSLASLMRLYADCDPAKVSIDYRRHQRAFGESFLDLVRSVAASSASRPLRRDTLSQGQT